MKTFLLLLLSCSLALAQVPPVLRHGLTTNTPNANQFALNSIKNGAQLTNANVSGTLTADDISTVGFESTGATQLGIPLSVPDLNIDGFLVITSGVVSSTSSGGSGSSGSYISNLFGLGTNITFRASTSSVRTATFYHSSNNTTNRQTNVLMEATMDNSNTNQHNLVLDTVSSGGYNSNSTALSVTYNGVNRFIVRPQGHTEINPNTSLALDQFRVGTAFNIISNGNVGIGTATPTNALNVIGVAGMSVGSAAAPSLQFGNLNSGFYGNSGSVDFSSGGTLSLRLQASGGLILLNDNGAVGIGSSSDVYYRRSASGVAALANGSFVSGTASLDLSNSFHRGVIYGTNGIATFSTNPPVSFTTSGYTNTTGKNVFVAIIGTALTVTKKETNGATLFAYGTITGTLPAIPLKPNQWLETSGTLNSNNVEPW